MNKTMILFIGVQGSEKSAFYERFSRLCYVRIQDGRFIVTPWQEEGAGNEV